MLPYAAIGFMLFVLQLKVEREECCAFSLGEFGLTYDVLFLLVAELFVRHTRTTLLVVLLLCRYSKAKEADEY